MVVGAAGAVPKGKKGKEAELTLEDQVRAIVCGVGFINGGPLNVFSLLIFCLFSCFCLFSLSLILCIVPLPPPHA